MNRDMGYEIQYRKDQRQIADLLYENQVLKTKISTLLFAEICTIVIFVVAIIVNMS